jgi:hypothetical protein
MVVLLFEVEIEKAPGRGAEGLVRSDYYAK